MAQDGQQPKVLTADMRLKSHVSTHLVHGVSMPPQFWIDHPHIRLCCAYLENNPTVFEVSTTGLLTCAECRKADRKARSHVDEQPSKSVKTGLPKPFFFQKRREES